MTNWAMDTLLPIGSGRRALVAKAYNKLFRRRLVHRSSFAYSDWIRQNEPTLWSVDINLQHKPLISIVVPCYNTPKKYIDPLVESVLKQTYGNWELCLADGSQDADRAKYISELSKQDTRIKYLRVDKDKQGIVTNTNMGLISASGEFVAFLDHDDILSKHALAEVVAVLNQRPGTDLVYSDEDKMSDDGKERMLPFFKPNWSPELLLGVNYITHFVVARKTIVDQIGGIRTGFDGAQDYDFLLRFTEKTDSIYHIPKILYHWRLADGSTAKQVGEKDYATVAGRKALAEALQRRHVAADALEVEDRPTNYRPKYQLKKQPKVSIIIPFKDKVDFLKVCVPSILQKTTYKNYEIILVSNNSTELATHQYLEELKNEKKCKVFEWNYPFNYSKVNNFGVSKSNGEYVVLLNNDTEVITPEWLEELVGVASQPGIGAVGPTLYYPEKKNGIQHAGIVVGMGGMAGHVFRHHAINDWTDFGMPAWPRNYLAVTGACLVVSRKLYDKVGGLDETFTVAGNDVAFGITLHEIGYRNVYWPFAALYHYENVSVGSYNNGIQLDYDHSLTYYKKYHEQGDPYFNPNLDPMNEQIAIRREYE